MSDTPETDALLRQQDRDSTPYDLSADQLVKLCRKLERERIEARQQEQIHHDNTLAMQKERDEALELLAAHAIKLQHELMRALKAECEQDEARVDVMKLQDIKRKHEHEELVAAQENDRLKKERDEARQQEQIHYDNFLSMQKERDEARGKYLKEKEELDKTLDELVEARGRIAGISGQLLCSAFYVGKLEKENAQLRAIAEAAVDWLNLGNPDDVRAGLHIRAKLDQLNEEAGK